MSVEEIILSIVRKYLGCEPGYELDAVKKVAARAEKAEAEVGRLREALIDILESYEKRFPAGQDADTEEFGEWLWNKVEALTR